MLEGKVVSLENNAAVDPASARGAVKCAKRSEKRATRRRTAEELDVPAVDQDKANINVHLTAPAIKKMKVAELRRELTARSLDTTGLKPALVARLLREVS